MIIKKKAWPDFFNKMLSGEKKFDIRLADFNCNQGDILILEEYDPKTNKYTGRKLEKRITYVTKTKDLKFWSEEEIEKHGFQILSLE